MTLLCWNGNCVRRPVSSTVRLSSNSPKEVVFAMVLALSAYIRCVLIIRVLLTRNTIILSIGGPLVSFGKLNFKFI